MVRLWPIRPQDFPLDFFWYKFTFSIHFWVKALFLSVYTADEISSWTLAVVYKAVVTLMEECVSVALFNLVLLSCSAVDGCHSQRHGRLPDHQHQKKQKWSFCFYPPWSIRKECHETTASATPHPPPSQWGLQLCQRFGAKQSGNQQQSRCQHRCCCYLSELNKPSWSKAPGGPRQWCRDNHSCCAIAVLNDHVLFHRPGFGFPFARLDQQHRAQPVPLCWVQTSILFLWNYSLSLEQHTKSSERPFFFSNNVFWSLFYRLHCNVVRCCIWTGAETKRMAVQHHVVPGDSPAARGAGLHWSAGSPSDRSQREKTWEEGGADGGVPWQDCNGLGAALIQTGHSHRSAAETGRSQVMDRSQCQSGDRLLRCSVAL